MSYNHGAKEREFNRMWSKTEKAYRDAGMSEYAIQKMYEYEREVFNSDRRYLTHKDEQPLDIAIGDDSNSDNGRLSLAPDRVLKQIRTIDITLVSTDKYSWIDGIEDEKLYAVLINMKDDYKELLTLYAIDGYSVGEIALMKGIAHQNVSKKLARIKAILKEFDL